MESFEVAEAFHRRGTAALSSFQTAHEQFHCSSAEVISQSPLVSGILASFQNKPPLAVPDPTKATSASPSAMHAIATSSSSPSPPLADYMAAGCTRPSKQQQAAVTLHTSLTLLQQLVELHQETVSEMEDIYRTAAARLLEENLHASAQPAGDDGVTAAAAGAVSGDIADVHSSNAAAVGAAVSADDGAGDGTDDKDSLGGAIAGTRSSVTVQADVVTMMAAVLEMLKEDLQMKLTIVADLSLSTSAAHVDDVRRNTAENSGAANSDTYAMSSARKVAAVASLKAAAEESAREADAMTSESKEEAQGACSIFIEVKPIRGNPVLAHIRNVRWVFGTKKEAPFPFFPPSALPYPVLQRGNPVLAHIRNVRNVRWAFGEITPDYLLSPSSCALFLSLRYHLLHPDYLYFRIRELQKSFRLRIVLCHVDVDDVTKPLHDITKTALLNDCTLLCAWSPNECARYLETFKSYENKPADCLPFSSVTLPLLSLLLPSATYLPPCSSPNECARYLETLKSYENKPANGIQERVDTLTLLALSLLSNPLLPLLSRSPTRLSPLLLPPASPAFSSCSPAHQRPPSRPSAMSTAPMLSCPLPPF
ncbi:unnamed protein product [Closterium sp. Naga37s-1]|nr:unnamed protein product [Closterium sp. Naga37s-1]